MELNSGFAMPIVGLGTYSLHGDVCVRSVRAALECGVRLVDTASIYGNEREVGAAGARMAAWLGSYGTEAFGRRAAPRPAAVIMAYTGLSEWQETDPATYMIQGTRDGIAPISVTDRRMRALERAGVKVRYERINGLPHGFGLGTGTAAEGWIGRATAFWREAREENSRREERS